MLRAQRKQEMKERIFERAMELFRQKGFEQVTVEEITAACGIAKGTFFNYFARKESVLLYLSESQQSRLDASLERLAGAPEFGAGIKQVFGELLARYEGDNGLLRMVLAETVRSAAAAAAEAGSVALFQQKLSVAVERAQRQGEVTQGHPAGRIAALLVGLYFQTLLAWSMLAGTPHEQRRLMFNDAFDLIWNGIKGNGGRSDAE